MVSLTVYVMCALLSKAQAWTVLDRVEARSLDLQDASSVAPWLLELGCAREVVEAQWSILVERCVKMAEARSGEAAGMMRQLVCECLNGKFARLQTSMDLSFYEFLWDIKYLWNLDKSTSRL